MKPIDYILLALVALAVILAVRRVRRRGCGCEGCSGHCEGCGRDCARGRKEA